MPNSSIKGLPKDLLIFTLWEAADWIPHMRGVSHRLRLTPDIVRQDILDGLTDITVYWGKNIYIDLLDIDFTLYDFYNPIFEYLDDAISITSNMTLSCMSIARCKNIELRRMLSMWLINNPLGS